MELYESIRNYAREAVIYSIVALAPIVFAGCPDGANKAKNVDEPNIEDVQRNIQAANKGIDSLTSGLDKEIAKTAAEEKKLDAENKGLMDKINEEAEEQKKKDDEILKGYGIK